MNTNQIKQRLIEAALTEDIPATPTFHMPRQHNHWIGYAAAACVAAAVILAIPTLSHRNEPATTGHMLLTTNDPATELEYAFAMVNEHFTMTNNLLQ